MFKPSILYYSDGYKIGHKKMLAKGTTRLYGTGIPRSTKYCPKGVTKIVSFGQQLTVRWLHDEFQENFFKQPLEVAKKFGEDMSKYLNLPFDSSHFEELHQLGYLPMQYQSLPEGIETNPNIPHITFINTKKGFGWLTLYLETIISALSWRGQVCATIALSFRRRVTEWVMKTDPSQAYLIPYMCHDFSARGSSPFDMISIGLGFTTSFGGSDTLIAIPAARYFYDEPEDEVIINSVNASEHSVSTTQIFTVGEQEMLRIWCNDFSKGILSVVSDTFDLWKLVTQYLPILKEGIKRRGEYIHLETGEEFTPFIDENYQSKYYTENGEYSVEYVDNLIKEGKIKFTPGKLVIRPDSGNPADIVCGYNSLDSYELEEKKVNVITNHPSNKGVVELLWDIFGGYINEQGYKVLTSVGVIYGDSINSERQLDIYKRLDKKKFAVTNCLLGVGSYTLVCQTRDTTGYAIKGAWFEIEDKGFNIYKDPATDDGTKKSLKGFQFVYQDKNGEYQVEGEVSEYKAYSQDNLLKTIYKDGKFYNQTTFKEIRERINVLSNKF